MEIMEIEGLAAIVMLFVITMAINDLGTAVRKLQEELAGVRHDYNKPQREKEN